MITPPGGEERLDGGKELPMNAPLRIVCAQVAGIFVGGKAFDRRLGKVRRIRNDEVPALARRDALEIVGMIDQNAIGKPIGLDSSAAGRDGLRIDIGETKRLAQIVRKQRKPDETRACAPLENATLHRHATTLQEWDEALSDPASAAVQMFLVIDGDRGEAVFSIREERPEERINMAAPELFELICHWRSDLRKATRPQTTVSRKICQP